MKNWEICCKWQCIIIYELSNRAPAYWQHVLWQHEIILAGPLGKTKYYAIHIKFQERDSPHVYSFIWIFNALNIENETAYIDFIGKTINA